MPFYKRDADTLLEAPNFVHGPGFSLLAGEHGGYNYPVDGWYWFDDPAAAEAALLTQPPDEGG